ncbi:sialate O-acetylesterase [Arundinibacter roseus]|uniref:Sialate O-acetylesterase n=1 Tax=Arundinibacter roseus TaxID=2070510 RepID=A0A4R4KKZ6_9BACT|nr:sialate O-acetylesterase [Arundinibacter roseus]TDB67349.1 sialate O-acetylesterase [Arundinibacter roseus]
MQLLNKRPGIFLLGFFSWMLLSGAQLAPRKMDLYLLIGQSNMAGRGAVDAHQAMPGIWAINAEGKWKEASDPLHFDKPGVVGVGPGLAFAEALKTYGHTKAIGLIPCAVGGSGIDDWQPGAKHAQTGIYPYDAMIERVKIATKQGRIRAILWHQGESDSSVQKSEVYEKKLEQFFERLRKELKAPKTPILIGTLGDFFVNKQPQAATINQIMTQFPQSHPNVYMVSAAGLTDKGDQTHFDTASARELGKRYAKILWEVQKN